jgi:hypothetical protein
MTFSFQLLKKSTENQGRLGKMTRVDAPTHWVDSGCRPSPIVERF